MSWVDKLLGYAPDIAGAILSGGATLPALAMKAISDATGQDINTKEQAEHAINSASPEVMLKVKQANNAFKIRMKELSNELATTEIADVQHARVWQKDSNMPAFICVTLTLAVIAFAAALMVWTVPVENVRLIDTLFGSVLTAWLGSLAFFNGTTRSSSDKNRALTTRGKL